MKLTTREMAEEFHQAFGHAINAHPLPYEEIRLRITLIEEEVAEYIDELWLYAQTGIISPNLLKERGDVQYVLDGTDVAIGYDAVEVTERVHNSNMTKLTATGEVLRRADGKVLKSDLYKAPDLSDLVPA